MSEKKKVTLYTDGACSGNPGLGGYAGILIYGDFRREYNAAEKHTTNNRMEVLAVIEGLKKLKYPCIVDVYSDSAYTVNAFLNGWVYAWKKNGWKKADNKPVSNVDLWEELYALTKTHEVTFHKEISPALSIKSVDILAALSLMPSVTSKPLELNIDIKRPAYCFAASSETPKLSIVVLAQS